MSEDDRSYEMLWECSACGTRGLLGKTHRHCPNCGAPQDPARRYFPPPGEEKEAVNHTFAGVDKTCPACGTPNGAKSSFCCNCAAPLEGARAVPLVGQSPPKAAPPEKRGWTGLQLGCAAALVLAIGIPLLLIFWKKDANAVVEKHRWERAVAIEEFAPRHEESWCDSMPSDAHGVSRRREQRSTRRIPNGEDCTTRNVDNGDGTFRKVRDCVTRYREEPVYDSKCYYTVDRWAWSREVNVAGVGLVPEPQWPRVSLARSGDCIYCEREGARSEKYLLDLKLNERSVPCETTEAVWRSAADGAHLALRVGVVGGRPDCSSIRVSP
jgi:hypothetical protein